MRLSREYQITVSRESRMMLSVTLLRKLYQRRMASPRIPSSTGLEEMRLRRTMLSSDCCRSMPKRQSSIWLSLMTLKLPRTWTAESMSLWELPELVRRNPLRVAPSVSRSTTVPLPPPSMVTWPPPSIVSGLSITTGPA